MISFQITCNEFKDATSSQEGTYVEVAEIRFLSALTAHTADK